MTTPFIVDNDTALSHATQSIAYDVVLSYLGFLPVSLSAVPMQRGLWVKLIPTTGRPNFHVNLYRPVSIYLT